MGPVGDQVPRQARPNNTFAPPKYEIDRLGELVEAERRHYPRPGADGRSILLFKLGRWQGLNLLTL